MIDDAAIVRELEDVGGGADLLPNGSYQAGCGMRADEEQAVRICELIAQLSRVSYIDFRVPAVTDRAFAHLEKVFGLKTLKLRRTQVTGRGLWILPGMTQLEKLVCDIREHLREGMQYIGRVASLRELHISGTPVSDEDLGGLNELTNLEKADLSRTTVSRGLGALSSCRRLRTLYLGDTQVDDAGMRAICDLTSLEELSLQNTLITDRGLEDVPKLQRLKWLGLSGTAVTWKGLERVAEIGGLEVLSFDDNRVTRRECSVLAQMSGLKRIHLREGFVGVPHVLYLRWKLPECRIRVMPRHKREKQSHENRGVRGARVEGHVAASKDENHGNSA